MRYLLQSVLRDDATVKVGHGEPPAQLMGADVPEELQNNKTTTNSLSVARHVPDMTARFLDAV